ncbi:MAG: hypothetical protein P8X74_19410 [Reinekea sp.]
MLPKNWGEPMGAPAIFEKQIEIKLLHPASTLESRIQVSLFNEAISDNRLKVFNGGKRVIKVMQQRFPLLVRC